MLLTKTVIVKWLNRTRKWYENKGYKFTKYNDEFEVKIEDISKCSNVLIEVKCDNPDCENPYLKPIIWNNYKKSVHGDGMYYCKKCTSNLFGKAKMVQTRLKNSKSFEQWCIEHDKQDILDRWDYELNGCKPSEISYSSNNKYYFKCPKNIHKSEQKQIDSFTNSFTRYKTKGVMECKQCNSFAQWGIDNICSDFLEKYWDYGKNTVNPWSVTRASDKFKVWIKCQNKDYHGSYDVKPINFTREYNRCPYCTNRNGKVNPLDSLGKLLEDKGLLNLWSDKNKKSPYEYTPKSSIKKVWWKCQNSLHEDYFRKISDSNTCGFRCPECQFSQGEHKISEYLIKNNINYTPQKEFDKLVGLGNRNLSYDFYLPIHNLLIEFQGEQHEKPIDFKGEGIKKAKEKFKQQQEHDKRKREYANNHNIKLLEIWYWDFDNVEKILDKELDLNNKLIKAV